MTQRAEARVAGIAYLSYIVFAMSSSILGGRSTAGGDTAQRLATLGRMMSMARVEVLLVLLQMVCALVLAAMLYRLTKAVSPAVALLAMLFRTGEGLLACLPLLSKLELMRLAGTPGGGFASTAEYVAVANELFKRPDEVFSEFFFVVGGFLFAYLLLSGRLIPGWLAWIGVVTIGVQLVCVPLQIAGMVPGPVVNLLWLPILLYEVPLGFLLIFKGVRESGLSPSS